MSLGDFLSGIGDVIQTGIQTLPAIIEAGQRGGAPIGTFPQLPPLAGFPGLSLQPGGGVVAVPGSGAVVTAGAPVVSGSCASFVPTRSRLRAQRELRAVNPSTGKIESWTHRGSPLIWSGDRAIAKRYAKVAGFSLSRRKSSARTAVRRRRTSHR